MQAHSTTYRILYNNKNITSDISDHLISLSYTDKVEGETDELEITLDDKDELWQNDWYPEKGASITAEIIHNGLTLACGVFTIDEINTSCSKDAGNAVSISCLAASITKKLRTKKFTSHENKTLKQLAQFVADQHSLTLQDNVPVIRFTRITQQHESDLAFLNRIAKQYGIIFSIRGGNLTFYDKAVLEAQPHIISLDKTQFTEYSFTDKNEATYKKAKVQYHNPAKNETIEHTEDANEDYTGGDDVLVIKDKVENEQQARHIAKAKLLTANSRQVTGGFQLPGNILIVSGVNVEVTGMGKLSGIFHITETTHNISRDGYTLSAEGKKVKLVDASKYRSRKKGVTNNRAAINVTQLN